MLSQDQLDEFDAQGFLVIKGFASQDEVDRLKRRSRELVDAFDPSSVSVFTTRNQASKTDRYFLDSSAAAHFFFEEKAFDAAGNLVKPKDQSINKIGHALHDLDPAFRSWARSDAIAGILRSLRYLRPTPVQSMIIFKQPGIGGEVVPHQDTTFLATEPQPSCLGLWLALEDATLDNGCLWTLPGSHAAGAPRRFVRAEDGSVSFEGEAPEFVTEGPESRFVPLEAESGTLVVLHGANVHMSRENLSGRSRMAATLHFVESTPGHEWSTRNWLQRPEGMPFEPLYDDASGVAAKLT